MINLENAKERHRKNLAGAVERLRSTMHADALRHADRMARVHNAYVITERDKLLKDAVDQMAGNVAGLKPEGEATIREADKRRALFVIGESGSGKTTAIKRLLSTRPEFQAYDDEYGRTVYPMISFEAPKPLTLKLLAKKGLEEAGYPVYGTKQENEMWDLFKEQIKERSILFVHIDEMQHVIKGNGHLEIQNIADVVKSLLQIKDWPVHAIFSGVPSLAKFLEHEKQLGNRCEIIKFDPMTFPENVGLIRKVLLRIITFNADLEPDDAVASNDEFIHRLIHATDGAFGTSIQMVRAAAGAVIYGGGETVTVDTFASVYARFTGCTPDKNVFTAPNWREIDPERSLADMIVDYERQEDTARKSRKR